MFGLAFGFVWFVWVFLCWAFPLRDICTSALSQERSGSSEDRSEDDEGLDLCAIQNTTAKLLALNLAIKDLHLSLMRSLKGTAIFPLYHSYETLIRYDTYVTWLNCINVIQGGAATLALVRRYSLCPRQLMMSSMEFRVKYLEDVLIVFGFHVRRTSWPPEIKCTQRYSLWQQRLIKAQLDYRRWTWMDSLFNRVMAAEIEPSLKLCILFLQALARVPETPAGCDFR